MIRPTILSSTARAILTAVAEHEAHFARAPQRLPAAARNAVFRSLINATLVEECPAPAGYVDLGWRQDQASTWMVLRITAAGLQAISTEPRQLPVTSGSILFQNQVPPNTPGGVSPAKLRPAASALLAAWDAGEDRASMTAAMEALRAALARPATPVQPSGTGASRYLCQGTKRQSVLTLLHRPEGATIAQIMDATGWVQHTVRAFLAGLKKRGHTVEVMERVRQVGPGVTGARGSYSVYHIAD